MAWIDIKKAYDSVDHEWLIEMMQVHRFPEWMVGVMHNLSTSWNTSVVTTTRCGREKSEMIKFKQRPTPGRCLVPKTVYPMFEPHCMESKSNGRVHVIKTDKHQSY